MGDGFEVQNGFSIQLRDSGLKLWNVCVCGGGGGGVSKKSALHTVDLYLLSSFSELYSKATKRAAQQPNALQAVTVYPDYGDNFIKLGVKIRNKKLK